MKQVYLLFMLSLLSACSTGGGSHGGQNAPAGAPGKSAYEIWLEQGNTGTEQDFLDSLIGGGNTGFDNNEIKTINYNKNAELKDLVEYGDEYGGHDYDYTVKDKPWAKYGGFKQYVGSYVPVGSDGSYIRKFVYNEKELKLANYGVESDQFVDKKNPGLNRYMGYGGYTTNRDAAYGANAYIPNVGAVFSGGTLAYITSDVYEEPTLIKGDATFKYDPTNPELKLVFDNYYQILIRGKGGATEPGHAAEYGVRTDGATIIVSGANHTGNPKYDLSTGTFDKDYGYFLRAQHFKQGNVEEAVGTYNLNIPSANEGSVGVYGAFGGSKQ